jgi:hypothetical protein
LLPILMELAPSMSALYSYFVTLDCILFCIIIILFILLLVYFNHLAFRTHGLSYVYVARLITPNPIYLSWGVSINDAKLKLTKYHFNGFVLIWEASSYKVILNRWIPFIHSCHLKLFYLFHTDTRPQHFQYYNRPIFVEVSTEGQIIQNLNKLKISF